MAAQVKHFFRSYGINRHKLTTLTESADTRMRAVVAHLQMCAGETQSTAIERFDVA